MVHDRGLWFAVDGEPPQKVRRILGAIADGADPAAVRDSTKGAPVVADLAARYLAEHVDVHNRPRTAKTVQQIVEGHLIPALGKQRVADVTRTDVVKLHHDMRQTPRHANHVISVLSKMMHLAEAWGWRSVRIQPLSAGETLH